MKQWGFVIRRDFFEECHFRTWNKGRKEIAAVTFAEKKKFSFNPNTILIATILHKSYKTWKFCILTSNAPAPMCINVYLKFKHTPAPHSYSKRPTKFQIPQFMSLLTRNHSRRPTHMEFWTQLVLVAFIVSAVHIQFGLVAAAALRRLLATKMAQKKPIKFPVSTRN